MNNNIEVEFIKINKIKIKEDRFRKVFTEKNLTGLQTSISTGLGLSNAITLTKDFTLITGESRLKSIKLLHEVGQKAFFQGNLIPEGLIPAIILKNKAEELELLEAEFNENVMREDFTYIEEAQAIAKIALIKQSIIDKDKTGKVPENILGIPLNRISKQAINETTQQIYEGNNSHFNRQVKTSLEITNALEQEGELSKKLQKANSLTEGQKILKNHALQEKRNNLAIKQGKDFSGKRHTIINGDCIEEMKKLPLAEFDVCLTDPIYGINSNNFNNSAGKYDNFNHDYDDSLETFKEIMPKAIKQVSRILKDSAHLYLACDIRNYFLLVDMVNSTSLPHNPWKVINAPFIQYKISGGRVPIPGFTPRRSYEVWLFAYRGNKQELKMINDVIPCESDRNFETNHGAGKPKELLKTFLNRSALPGDKVIDFMAGSGTIIPACHELKIKCTAIEKNKTFYGECLERLKEL